MLFASFLPKTGFLFLRRPINGVRNLIQGKIDALTPGGVFLGWVRDDERPDACRVQVSYAGEKVAEAVASLFRRDVLQGGRSHGHHGFRARLLRPLPPGLSMVMLDLPTHDAAAAMQVDVPELEPPTPERVEDILHRPPGWTVADVAAHPACLYPQANCARLGPARFTDAVFRFVFGRWPSEAESRMNTDALAAGRITPRGLLLECLASRERAESSAELPGPFDARFPFTLSGQLPPIREAA